MTADKYKVTRKNYGRGVRVLPDGKIQVIVPRKNKRPKKKAKKGSSKFARFCSKNYKNVLKISLLICGAMLVVALGSYVFDNANPYAIVVDGEPACYCDSEKDANATLDAVVDNYVVKDTQIKAFNVSSSVSIEPAKKVARDDRLGVKEATDFLINEYIPNNEIVILATSTKEIEEEFVPEPEYKLDEEMLAGEERVESEAVNGKHIVVNIYSSQNGVVVYSDSFEKKVLDPGTPAVIYKGNLGLPEGEDWQTYTGDPVFKDGEDLIKTAESYKGLRYVYGGNSLTKGVDCVTFVWNMYNLYGIKLGCSHAGLQRAGKAVKLKDAQKGDIVCYYGHVALYLGDGKIIHASPGKGVHVSNNVSYRKIKTIRRVVN